jgi:hypothetical protein
LFVHLALSVILGAAGRSETASAGGRTAGPQMTADTGALDRMSFAVESAELGHGADPGMWRFAPDAPQGPMQVSAAALDRMSFAVESAESDHGADPGMWRFAPDAPQGPMQVSAAAASDAGGGDRFNEPQNRALGGSYLARMFRHYGSWPDAVVAYNWGPARIDRWISDGRLIDKLPTSVARYQTRVLAESGAFAGIATRLAQLRLLRLEAKRQLIERRNHGYCPDAVELLYAEIMRATSGPVE